MDTKCAVGLVCELLIDCVDTSDSSDEECDLLELQAITNLREENRPRVHKYIENVVHLYSNEEFKSHFRMNRTTFEGILRLIAPELTKKSGARGVGRETVPPHLQLLLSIWTFSTPDSYRSICDRFNVGRATAVRTIRRVIKALLQLKTRFITWPDHNEARRITHAMERVCGFPNVIGIIDGTHIKIAAPAQNAAAYINRKNFHSIQLQVVCDDKRRFIHCYVGQPGSVHDQRVFRLSPLQDLINNAECFPQNTHLIGDAAYSLHKHLLVPFKDNGHLTQLEQNYNYCLSSTRMTVERAIGLLKGRFRSLLDRLDMKRTDIIPYYILACCVLHNMCLSMNDSIDTPVVVNGDPDIPMQRRDILRRAAQQKRDDIMHTLEIRI